MAASEELDKSLQERGFSKDSNGDYFRVKENGSVERVSTDGNHSQSSDDNWAWRKHS